MRMCLEGGGVGGGVAGPPSPLPPTINNNLCKDDSGLFSMFLHGSIDKGYIKRKFHAGIEPTIYVQKFLYFTLCL